MVIIYRTLFRDLIDEHAVMFVVFYVKNALDMYLFGKTSILCIQI